MFSFLLIVAVFSHTDAACNEGDQLKKVMKLDGSPACRHCHCWRTVEWICVVERSACNYSKLVKNQQTDPKQKHIKTNDNVHLSSERRCHPDDRIVKSMTFHNLPACQLCNCWGMVKWECTVQLNECNMAALEYDLCHSRNLRSQKILRFTEDCLFCTCRRVFLCYKIDKIAGNLMSRQACGFTEDTATSSITTTAATITTTAATTTAIRGSSMTTNKHQHYRMYHAETNFKANWSMSRHHCEERGMMLATISTEKEDQRVYEIIKKFPRNYNFYWTSGTDRGHKGKFIWNSTGKPVTYTNWLQNEPDNRQNSGKESQDCLSVEVSKVFNTYGWSADFCDILSYFVCQNKK